VQKSGSKSIHVKEKESYRGDLVKLLHHQEV